MLCLRRAKTNEDGLGSKLSAKSSRTCKQLGFSVRMSGSEQSALNITLEKEYWETSVKMEKPNLMGLGRKCLMTVVRMKSFYT